MKLNRREFLQLLAGAGAVAGAASLANRDSSEGAPEVFRQAHTPRRLGPPDPPFVPNPVPLIFGGIVACGLSGDELTGTVNLPLFTNGYATMTFDLPSAQTSIQVALCMVQVGSPSAPVTLSLQTGSTVVATGSISASEVPTGSPGWTQFVTLSGSMAPGYYTLYVRSPSSTSTDYYLVYINFYVSFEDIVAHAGYIPPTGSGYYGNQGSPVVWIKDPSSNDIAVFPFGKSGSGLGNGTFVAKSSYQVSCLLPWLSDMEYILPPYSAKFTLTDLSTNTVLGSAPASQYYNSHGIMGVVPLQLPGPVNVVKGHTYSISISETGNASSTSAYPILIRGSVVNPAKSGPSGTSTYWYGELALSDFSAYRVLDYAGTTTTTQNGHGGIGGNDQIAVRFVPTFSETITQVKLKMSNAPGAPPTSGNYASGTTVTIGLYASNESASSPEFANPTGSALATATADSGTIPLVGFFNATVSFAVTAGTPYWIVWSASSAATSAYSCERCVSPFRNLALATQNAGSSWTFFGQGPTDLAWAAVSSDETIGSPYDNAMGQPLTSVDMVAQPFSLSSASEVNCVYASASGGTVAVAIYPDNGSGTGPNMTAALGSGTFDTAYRYFYSGIVVPLAAPVAVSANTKYWIVFSSLTSSSVVIASYWTRPSDPSVPSGYEALVSSNGGSSWSAAASEVASTIFMVGVQPAGVVVPTASVGDALAAQGDTTYGVVAYSQPTLGPSDVTYYLSQGFKVYPWQDGSNGYSSSLLGIQQEFAAGAGATLGPSYGWGYATQFYNLGRGFLATLYPSEQEYYLSGGSLSAAQSYGYNGIVIDAPELVTEWLYEYGQIDSHIGLQNLLGIAGWVNSDHPVNYGGAAGASGGHNMNTYVRYVNSPLGLYLNDVHGSGLHNSDNSSCLLWALVGGTANYTAATCEPTVAMATDVGTYHHSPQQTSTFGLYCAAANASLEYQLLQAVQAKTKAFARTAMPTSVLKLIPNYYSSVLEVTSSSIYTNSAGQVLMGSRGDTVCCPYFNFANADDDSSNPGRNGYYEVAYASTVLSFWTGVVPLYSHYPIMEADTSDPTTTQTQVSATSWSHFGPLYGSMPYVGRLFGYEKDAVQALVVGHNYGDLHNWIGLFSVAHLTGTDSYSSLSGLTLSDYGVVIGIPNSGQDSGYSADLALLEAYVSGGGTLIVYSNSGAPSGLTGIGTTATPLAFTHPIYAPYAQADLVAAGHNGNDYVNQYGSGQVITLHAYGYGDGFGVGDAMNGSGAADGMSSGLAYLTINAVLWAAGIPTPAIYLPQYVQRTSWAVALNGSGQGGSPPVIVSVCGAPSGQKLIWLSNSGTSTPTVQLSFSQAFFGTVTAWAAYDANSQTNVASGSGDVALNLTLPAQDWRPLYVQAGSVTSTSSSSSTSSSASSSSSSTMSSSSTTSSGGGGGGGGGGGPPPVVTVTTTKVPSTSTEASAQGASSGELDWILGGAVLGALGLGGLAYWLAGSDERNRRPSRR